MNLTIPRKESYVRVFNDHFKVEDLIEITPKPYSLG